MNVSYLAFNMWDIYRDQDIRLFRFKPDEIEDDGGEIGGFGFCCRFGGWWGLGCHEGVGWAFGTVVGFFS